MKVFDLSYKHNGVYQAIMIEADTTKKAIDFFQNHKPDAEVYGAKEINETQKNSYLRRGKPLLTAQ